MKAYDVNAIRDRFRNLDGRANERLGAFDDAGIGIGRYVAGASPWERHDNGDELLYVIEGSVQIEVLETGSSFRATLSEGSLFTVPRGRWHQLVAEAPVQILYLSPTADGVVRTRERPPEPA